MEGQGRASGVPCEQSSSKDRQGLGLHGQGKAPLRGRPGLAGTAQGAWTPRLRWAEPSHRCVGSPRLPLQLQLQACAGEAPAPALGLPPSGAWAQPMPHIPGTSPRTLCPGMQPAVSGWPRPKALPPGRLPAEVGKSRGRATRHTVAASGSGPDPWPGSASVSPATSPVHSSLAIASWRPQWDTAVSSGAAEPGP